MDHYESRQPEPRTGNLRLDPLLLGLSATIATLLIYEPALHSFVNFAYFDEFITPFSLAALSSCAIVALFYALRSRFSRSTHHTQRALESSILILSTAGGSLGFLLLVVFEGTLALHLIVGMFAGISSALTIISWGRVYVGCSLQKALLHIALSSIIAALLMNAMGTLPFPVTAVFFVALSGASALLPLAESRRHIPDDTDALTSDGSSPAPSTARHMFLNLLEPMAGIFLFSLVFATLGDHREYLFYLSFLLGTLLSGICIIPLLMVNSRRPILTLIYQVVMPLMGLILLVVILVVPDGSSGMVARNGFMLFFAFASMLFCASVVGYATAAEFNAGLILGSAVATFALGGLAGTVLSLTIGRGQLVTGIFLALTCAYVIFLAVRPSIMSWMGQESTSFGAPSATGDTAVDDTCRTFAHEHGLTEREREILTHVVVGRSSSYIARTLFISESTVRGHVHHIYQKLGVSSRDELAELVATTRTK